MGIRSECNIVYDLGNYWVKKTKEGYYVLRTGLTHSTMDSAYPLTDDGLSIAIARCQYLSNKELDRLKKSVI